MRTVTRAASWLLIALGVAIVVRTLAGGGGPLAFGILVGLLFVAAGGLRLYGERRP